jgi:hypothetical protein
MTTTPSAGQALTAELRRYFSVGTRTRRARRDRNGDRQDLPRDMLEALHYAAQYPGYYTPATEAAFRPGFGAALAYDKHVNGYRIDGALRWRITEMSPWRLAELFGQMVDAGVTCTGDGERFFADMARAMRIAELTR